ncbi:MAG: SAM-dependent chlorinase/fluorinase [Chloroflexi bacterium]|nr:SAM-dependent chlorinase/fluorinase [Chloroflexota bacterium]
MPRRNDAGSPPIITLTTDFGLADHYVAVMKGVILGICRDAAIVDVSHAVRPQRLVQAVFLTQAAWPAFPPDSVHVAVVDPTVGSQRRGLVIATPHGLFVGPDNGVLSAALPEETRPAADRGAGQVALPAGHLAFAITNRELLRETVSATFHGRDVFAPIAAYLARGVPAHEVGEPVQSVCALPPLRAARRDDGMLDARVVHIDRFGNVVTDARAEDLPEGPFAVEIGGQSVRGPVHTYADAQGLAALAGSGGYLEIVLPMGDASAALAVDIDDTATVRPLSDAAR